MTEAKHTPGPWVVFYKAKYDEWHVSVPAFGMKLALFPDGIRTENHEADARLIASAPDLLEALQRIMEDMDSEFGTDYDYNKARAAIAKATGN